jgi:cholesterol oxidase
MSERLLETSPARRAEPAPARAALTSLSFEEEMAGAVVPAAAGPGAAGEPLSFRLKICIDDLDTFLAEPEHLARAEGWVDGTCPGGRRVVERGWFNLFAPGEEPGSRVMRYHLWFTDGDGNPRTLSGWKDVHDGPVTRMWHDTSTLYTSVLRGHVPPDAEATDVTDAVATGTLHIEPTDLVATLASFRADGPRPVAALARFGRFFVGELWDVYGPG